MPDPSARLRPLLVPQLRLALTILAAAAVCALPGVARADTAVCATSMLSTASQPACWRPFTGSSPFNTEFPSNPLLAPDNAAVQQHMAQYGWSLDGSTGGFTLHGGGSRPVYFATPADPVVSVHCTDQAGPGTCQGADGIDVNGAQINVPAGAAPDSNSDAHMTVIEVATGIEYDFWHASISGSTLTAGTGAELNATTGDGTGSGGDAAGFGLTAGLLRPAELASGQIDHALVITVPCTNATGRGVGYTYPARGGWGQYCGQFWNEDAATAPMLGQRYQLNMTDAQIAASGAPPWEQTIMTALAHYGAYIEDTNGSWHYEGMDILTQDPASWTDVGQPNTWTSVVSALGGTNSTLHSSVPIPVSRLQLVNTCVTRGTCPGAVGVAPTSGTIPATMPGPVIPPALVAPVDTPAPAAPKGPGRNTESATSTHRGSTTSSTTDPAPAHTKRAARRSARDWRRGTLRRRLRRLRTLRRLERSVRGSRRDAHHGHHADSHRRRNRR